MRIIITGLNGTVAPVVADKFSRYGHTVIGWDRSVVPTDDEIAIDNFLESHHPDWFLHIATGSPEWASLIAKICSKKKIKLLFTSSVSVYSSHQKGPFPLSVLPQPADDYGLYKLQCEKLISNQHPEVIITRLAWQIGDTPGSNNMIDYLYQELEQKGHIEASRNWFPACAFLNDTAEALYQLTKNFPADTYHLDGNPGLSFFEIVHHLNKIHGGNWKIIPAEEPVLNNRLLDDRIEMNKITESFTKSQ